MALPSFTLSLSANPDAYATTLIAATLDALATHLGSLLVAALFVALIALVLTLLIWSVVRLSALVATLRTVRQQARDSALWVHSSPLCWSAKPWNSFLNRAHP